MILNLEPYIHFEIYGPEKKQAVEKNGHLMFCLIIDIDKKDKISKYYLESGLVTECQKYCLIEAMNFNYTVEDKNFVNNIIPEGISNIHKYLQIFNKTFK